MNEERWRTVKNLREITHGNISEALRKCLGKNGEKTFLHISFSSNVWLGMSHIISMIYMQQWWLGNFTQNWSCMHPCGHSSIKFLRSCDTRVQDSFSLFYSTQCFQNMFFYQFMHSSESILGVRENFHSIHPSGVYTFFFKNWLWSVKFFFKEKLEVISFQKHIGFLARPLIIIFFLFFFFFFSSFFLLFFKLLPFVHFLSFFFFSLKRSCGRGHTLPTYV